jgi:hypothetical protein
MLRTDSEGRMVPFAISGPGGEALATEPYPHYMNDAELRRYGQDWLKRLQGYPQWDFVSKYLPARGLGRETAKMTAATPWTRTTSSTAAP